MSPRNYTCYSWFLAIAAFVIMAAACFAPWLFSKPGCIDFTATGEIGDTIGGTMSPFAGIAGVLMIFVAFLKQVRANEIQRGQLGKSFNLKEMELLKLEIALNQNTEENIINEFEGKI